jgi:hypothetical protein
MVPSDDMRANAVVCLSTAVGCTDFKSTYVWLATAFGYIALHAVDMLSKFDPGEVNVRFDSEGKLIT